jgi:hypothetical protein
MMFLSVFLIRHYNNLSLTIKQMIGMKIFPQNKTKKYPNN